MRDQYRALYDDFRWHVPREFNIAEACCRRWAQETSRIALHYEDEAGSGGSYTYAALQADANRLSNALRALGVQPGDRVAIVLPQSPETAVSHVAIYQMGAVAMPLSLLFGPDALEYRLQNSEAVVAIVDASALPALASIRANCPALKHLVVVGTADGEGHAWSTLLAKSSDRFALVTTLADDPALLIYTSGTTGPPKGALMPHRALIGNLPGFVASQDWFPQRGDVFWSPADWAWTGGLMDALLPTMYFGFPIVGTRGRFSPERAFELMQRHRVTSAFLFPTALKMMMKSVAEPRSRYVLGLRSMMSAGESVGATVFTWCREAPMPRAASRIDGGTAFTEARVTMIMVGSVISASTSPPTRGAERGIARKLIKNARPSRPKMIDGTAARLLMLTSIRSIQRFFGANSSR